MPTLQQNEVREFVLTTLVTEMNIPIERDSLDDDCPIGTNGIDLESLSLVELTLRLEREFDITIPDSDIERIGAMTLGELVEDVVRRREAA
ncbi:acyl carrier protein [Goodfellowiella coeruleoviolacea]|uniref:Acyl carrier protein n=1 Tax=Goodfellowiella coeruleoviolacea TaxID=334858 RepID=A0AAE3KIV3_9PSEU|nr:acyl carrier protein [Goodfellowiella coeruleoviolacea]MCP2163658.1 acyl carrier protein [Goodfellowiella coeruleoviolacea]